MGFDGISKVIDMIFYTIGQIIDFAKNIFMLPLKVFASMPDPIKTGFAAFLIGICIVIVIALWKNREEFKKVYAN